MKQHALQVICVALNFEVIDYSGRGMYGKRCLGVVSDLNEGRFFAKILSGLFDYGVSRAVDYGDDEVEEPDQDVVANNIAEAFKSFQKDSMGTSNVFYFPSVAFVTREESKKDAATST